MPMPLFGTPANTSADGYQSGHAPPAAPDYPALAGNLQAWGRNIHARPPWTHWLDLPLATAVAELAQVYVPDQTGTPFTVVGYERVYLGAGGVNDYWRVYLQRGTPPWPTNQL